LKKLRIIIVNETSDPGCPVSKLAFDLGGYLISEGYKVSQFYVTKKYLPGGFTPRRVINLVLAHFILPIWIMGWTLLGLLKHERLILLATTMPPLIHWTSLVFGRLLGSTIITWYQDAHPDLEAQLFAKYRIPWVGQALQWVNRGLMRLNKGIIFLDHVTSIVAPPWVTYLQPARPLRKETSSRNRLKLLYAGNYGIAHDLKPLVLKISTLPTEEQQRLHLTFVGMNQRSQQLIAKHFSQVAVDIKFLPRFAAIEQLSLFMAEFDFGVVSLHSSLLGFACPSKAFSYLSQGLPIFYVGPAGTLSDKLCRQSWGVHYQTSDLLRILHTDAGTSIRFNDTFPDPALASKVAIADFIRMLS